MTPEDWSSVLRSFEDQGWRVISVDQSTETVTLRPRFQPHDRA